MDEKKSKSREERNSIQNRRSVQNEVSHNSKPNRASSKSRSTQNRRERSRSPRSSWNLKQTWKSANAFINFMEDFRKEHPDVKSPQTFKLAGEKWRSMTTAEKQPYIDAANLVKKQKQKNEGRQKSNVTPASKKIVLSKEMKQQKNEARLRDNSEESDSAASTTADNDQTATSGAESSDDEQ